MKDLNLYISEAIKITSKSKVVKYDDIDDHWSGEKYIKKSVLFDFCIKALKDSKTSISKIINEFFEYDNNDQLNRARDNDQLRYYNKFENSLANLLADDDKYCGLEGDICDNLFDDVHNIMQELYKYTR